MKLWRSECERKQKHTKSISGKMAPRISSFFDLVTIGIGSSLAFGISVLIGGLIKNVGPAVVVSISMAGVTAIFGGLCFAEFGARFLRVDSAYVYSYFSSRENAAFIFGWALILEYVAGTASAGKGIVTFIDALTDHKITDVLRNSTSTGFPEVFPYFDFFSFGVIVVFTILIMFGVKDSIIVKKIFTTCSVVLVVSVIVAGTFKADTKNWKTEENEGENSKNAFAPFGVLATVKGAALAFYGFIGFDTVGVSGDEVKKRKRNLPLAILATVLVTLVSYAGIGVVLTLMVPYDEVNPHAAVPFAFQQVGWITFKWVVAVATFFGFQTGLFGAMFSLCRIIRDMANDGLLFRCLSKKKSKSKTPVMASMNGGLLAAAGAGIFSFQNLVDLTIIGALFVHTVLAVNVVLLRYSPKFETEEKPSESLKNLISEKENVSVRAVVQNYFNFKNKHPTNFTKRIIIGNVILFCISSIALSLLFNILYDSLVVCDAEAVVPASIFLGVMLLSLLSMTCQPKSREIVQFKVPLIPLIPCLSVFLNIFLMLTFGLLTWILFLSWMAIGILPYFFWRLVKYFKGEIGEDSLYEINKTNAVKLNNSIWQMKSSKKSFYEGAVNPGFFFDDLEDDLKDAKTSADGDVKKYTEKTSFQLKQAEIIQTAELVTEEKVEPLEKELELNFFRVNSAEIVNTLPEEDEKVRWECVAEIHSEKEYSQESVALEIVDNTYNFLSEVSEVSLKDDVNFQETSLELTSLEKESDSKSQIAENDAFSGTENYAAWPDSQQDSIQLLEKYNEKSSLDSVEKDEQNLLEKELGGETEFQMNDKDNEKTESGSAFSDPTENTQPTVLQETRSEVLNENLLEDVLSQELLSTGASSSLGELNQHEEHFVNLIVETIYEAHKSEKYLKENNVKALDTSDTKATKLIPDEQNKIKEFKEKLNQLLKNQINNNATLGKNPALLKTAQTDDIEMQNEKNKDALYNSIKTLNKSQIKGKLELLLAKGPPKRPSLKSSFHLKSEEAERQDEIRTSKDEILRIDNNVLNDSGDKENFIKSPVTLPDSIKEKILSLKNADSETSNDACC